MNVHIPELNGISCFAPPERRDYSFSAETFKKCVDRAAGRFLYEPMTESVMDQMARYMAREISDKFEGSFVKEIKVDDMRDLDCRRDECRKCAEAGSYEEYKIRRAAENMPDEAGSEDEWRRMAEYRPGSVRLNAVFAPSGCSREVELEFRVG